MWVGLGGGDSRGGGGCWRVVVGVGVGGSQWWGWGLEDGGRAGGGGWRVGVGGWRGVGI